jgi:NADPH-dependent F420 reductase
MPRHLSILSRHVFPGTSLLHRSGATVQPGVRSSEKGVEEMSAETVAILGGTGPQGRGMALRFARAGVRVVIGSRDASRAREAAAALGGEGSPDGGDLPLSGADNAAATSAAEIVFVAVPWDAHEATLRSLVAELAGKVVVDLVNPLSFDERGPVCLTVAEGSSAEQAQALLPDSIVVSGFHHVSAKLLLDERGGVDTDILVCGDDREAKRRVMALADLIPEARPVDAGPLRLAQFLEGLTAVILSVNRQYRTNTGVHLTNLDLRRARD